jgi:antitoxin component of MazEF toxin-antitoxin module
MVKKLTRHGNSLALVIDKPILELLNITKDTPLEITTDGRSLIICPSRSGDRRSALHYFLQNTAKTLGPALEGLDD